MIRVILCDDHAVVRTGYRRLLALEGDRTVGAEHGDGEAAYGDLQRLMPRIEQAVAERLHQVVRFADGGRPVTLLLHSLWPPALLALVFGVLTALAFSLPALGRALSVSPAALFRGVEGQALHTPRRARWLTAGVAGATLALTRQARRYPHTKQLEFLCGVLQMRPKPRLAGVWSCLDDRIP